MGFLDTFKRRDQGTKQSENAAAYKKMRTITLKRMIIFGSLLISLSGCGSAIDNQEVKDSKDTKNITNTWFDTAENVAYKGDSSFPMERPDTFDCHIRNVYVGESPQGALYQLMIDVPAVAQVPEEVLNIGFFYVEPDRIYRMLELSQEEQRKLLADGEIPDSAVVICQEQAIKDKNNKKGWHERIDRNGELTGYYRWNDETATNFYEWIIWKEHVGIILYKRGYAAELEDITMWREQYVEKPHDFDLYE